MKSQWEIVLEEVPEEDRAWVAREARIYLNMVGRMRPSDAARSTVRAYKDGTLRRTVFDENGNIV